MKKLIGITIIVVLALTATTVFAAIPPEEGWTLGNKDGAVDPINGSSEYPAKGNWTASFDYTVTQSDPSPSMPGYIGPANVCDFASGRPCTDTTAELNLIFDLTCGYSELTLIYARYGSEADNILFDDVQKDTVAATEGGWNVYNINLGSANAGSHTLTIEYAGGGSGNGHYIDAIELVPGGDVTCPVVIDIKPGSDPNAFNINDHGVIPVAILGSMDFDVNDIDIPTVSFAGLAVRVTGKAEKTKCAFEDVNMDGYMDLVCQFDDDANTWAPGDGIATLEGYLIDGTGFYGSDFIKVVPE